MSRAGRSGGVDLGVLAAAVDDVDRVALDIVAVAGDAPVVPLRRLLLGLGDAVRAIDEVAISVAGVELVGAGVAVEVVRSPPTGDLVVSSPAIDHVGAIGGAVAVGIVTPEGVVALVTVDDVAVLAARDDVCVVVVTVEGGRAGHRLGSRGADAQGRELVGITVGG